MRLRRRVSNEGAANAVRVSRTPRLAPRRVLAAIGTPVVALAAVLATATPASAYESFKTVGTDVHIRKCEFQYDSACTIVKTMPNYGTSVSVICWQGGSSVNGDSIWYEINFPAPGWVAGYWLNTGTDPNSSVPQCRS